MPNTPPLPREKVCRVCEAYKNATIEEKFVCSDPLMSASLNLWPRRWASIEDYKAGKPPVQPFELAEVDV